MRSLLLLRADCDNDVGSALRSAADCLVFDLVPPAAAIDMPAARQRALAALRQARQSAGTLLLYVRIGAVDGASVDADLDALMPGRPDGILLSGSENGADVQHLSVKLAVREAELGLGDGTTKIIASVAARPGSIFQMGSYAGASGRLAGLVFGATERNSAPGGAARKLPDGIPGPSFTLARSLTLCAAEAAAVVAIDAASPMDGDTGSLSSDCNRALRDGFSAKLAVHKDQVAIINAVFAAQ